MSLEILANEVLRLYPAPLRGSLLFLGNHGGFSGAHLWRLDAPAGAFCLKAWPREWRSAEELAWIHDLMTRAESFPWMPRIMRTIEGASLVVHHRRLWEIERWMPGSADFEQSPSAARLESACAALAQLHQAWMPLPALKDVAPAVLRRWESWQRWHHFSQSGWQPVWNAHDPHLAVTRELWQLVLRQIDEVPRLLAPWQSRTVALQPCVCDLWHDHVFYTGDEVTGLIDFGSVKLDHVAVDLARMLGSLAGDDAASWTIGISAYRRVRPLSAQEESLARDLDRTGTILAATHWLHWLYREQRKYDHPDPVRRRLMQLTHRLRSIRTG